MKTGQGILLGIWAFCVYPLAPTWFFPDRLLEADLIPFQVSLLFAATGLAWWALEKRGLEWRWRIAGCCWLIGWAFTWVVAGISVARTA